MGLSTNHKVQVQARSANGKVPGSLLTWGEQEQKSQAYKLFVLKLQILEGAHDLSHDAGHCV